jgi:hypothetical protein
MTLAEIKHMNAGLIISWLWFKPISKKLIADSSKSRSWYKLIVFVRTKKLC